MCNTNPFLIELVTPSFYKSSHVSLSLHASLLFPQQPIQDKPEKQYA
uniref:Uncharacterized protein n=1 Tax=Rhizophora mucronata TaxID=61149 RepID=A0A2P2R4S2_RHIMU